jgi:hypothetical protein
VAAALRGSRQRVIRSSLFIGRDGDSFIGLIEP